MNHTPSAHRAALDVAIWGSVWGLAEFSLGHLLHLLPPPSLTGSVMFPIGFFCMVRAWRATGSPSAILAMAPVAAAWKLLDLALPLYTPLSALNPALAILLEAAVVYAGVRAVAGDLGRLGLSGAWLASLGWRVGFAVLQLGAAALLPVPTVLDRDPAGLLRFFLIEPAANALLIAAAYSAASALRRRRSKSAAVARPSSSGPSGT